MARVLKTECHKAQMFEQSVQTNWNNDIKNISYGLIFKRKSSVKPLKAFSSLCTQREQAKPFYFAPLKLVPLCQSRAIHPQRVKG